MKRILTIQDISCVGKCSLTVALPVLSALGLETAVLPTSVLSNHTGFPDYTFRDLTEDIPDVLAVWEKNEFAFDGLYTGYLGSEQQIDLVVELRERFLRPGGLFLVDPVMGDAGKLYPGFDMDFVAAMRGLIARADVIVPNRTEASLLLGREYRENGYDRAGAEQILRDLAECGAKIPILTGVSFPGDRLGALAFDRETGVFFEACSPRVPQFFHGTGDLFASTVMGVLSRGSPIPEAIRIASEFTHASILATRRDPDANWYGVNFEEALPDLIRMAVL